MVNNNLREALMKNFFTKKLNIFLVIVAIGLSNTVWSMKKGLTKIRKFEDLENNLPKNLPSAKRQKIIQETTKRKRDLKNLEQSFSEIRLEDNSRLRKKQKTEKNHYAYYNKTQMTWVVFVCYLCALHDHKLITLTHD
jgi:hypothetical protein